MTNYLDYEPPPLRSYAADHHRNDDASAVGDLAIPTPSAHGLAYRARLCCEMRNTLYYARQAGITRLDRLARHLRMEISRIRAAHTEAQAVRRIVEGV